MKRIYFVIILIFAGCYISINAQDNSFVQSTELRQNFPNPFNPTTQIEYFLPKKTFIELNIYNILGIKLFELVKGEQDKGWYNILFNAENLSSGLYVIELLTSVSKQTRKMLVMK